MEEFKQRLLLYVENLGKSVRAFEQECGLNNGTIASIKVKGPGVEVVSKISYAHPDLNLNWLFRGEGKMLNPEPSDSKAALLPPAVEVHKIETVNIGNWSELVELIKSIKQ